MENTTSRFKLTIVKKRYREWLERANDVDALALIWAVNAVQSGKAKLAARYIAFPKEAVIDNMVDQYAIYKWELETIVTSLLTTSKDKHRNGRYKYTNLTKFGSLGALVNLLREMENGEYAMTGTADNIWEEMYRIGQRQFAWQRGYNAEQLYRYAYVYGLGECGAFFEERNGISVANFLFLSLALFGLTPEKPWTTEPDTSSLGLPQSDMAKTLALHSIGLSEARAKAARMNADAVRVLGAPLRTAYMPSVLRQHPIICVKHRHLIYIAPLPPLIMNRATSGLYYDIKQGPTRLLTDANARFEDYIRKLVVAYHPRFHALKGLPYGRSKATLIDPPDCLIKDGTEITAAIECKATKLTFEAQFSDNPTIAAKQGFDQVAKGIFQLWRFFSHARRGIYSANTVSPAAYGIVLTMDGWMQMATKLRRLALEQARQLAASDPDIIEADMRMVIFASIQELNDCFAQTETDTFMEVLKHAVDERYEGYGLLELTRQCGVPLVRRRFPLDVGEILPWWNKTKNPDDRPYL
ncbi:hypothetical protein N1937_06945 [Rhizobium sp. WSM4643]|uniref:hypothetical protein n=1 Tax=Rhizobium sp. WSM4643 TaxID=3138253 RepID=UPI0021A6C06B|nr:hypothetical protein [Rhizobium leguminosarum]UWM76968.1 hypothetical protein N1937_06945 [Rhizobium leguminosarum bv. viciae]